MCLAYCCRCPGDDVCAGVPTFSVSNAKWPSACDTAPPYTLTQCQALCDSGSVPVGGPPTSLCVGGNWAPVSSGQCQTQPPPVNDLAWANGPLKADCLSWAGIDEGTAQISAPCLWAWCLWTACERYVGADYVPVQAFSALSKPAYTSDTCDDQYDAYVCAAQQVRDGISQWIPGTVQPGAGILGEYENRPACRTFFQESTNEQYGTTMNFPCAKTGYVPAQWVAPGTCTKQPADIHAGSLMYSCKYKDDTEERLGADDATVCRVFGLSNSNTFTVWCP